MPDCLALWLPKVGAGDTATREGQARWVAEHFIGRTWIAFERHLRPDDGERLAALRELAAAVSLPLLAAGDAHMQRYREEFDTVTAIFNDAWSQNWGFIAFTEAEIAHMAKSLKMLIDPNCVAIVEMNGEAIGFGIALPNLNELIADFGGNLLPFNWIKLMYRLRRGARTARVPLMGIRRSCSTSFAGGLAPFLVIDALRKGLRAKGVKQVELSWRKTANAWSRR